MGRKKIPQFTSQVSRKSTCRFHGYQSLIAKFVHPGRFKRSKVRSWLPTVVGYFSIIPAKDPSEHWDVFCCSKRNLVFMNTVPLAWTRPLTTSDDAPRLWLDSISVVKLPKNVCLVKWNPLDRNATFSSPSILFVYFITKLSLLSLWIVSTSPNDSSLGDALKRNASVAAK